MSIQFIVTGAAGFIGSNLVSALNARGHDRILLVDALGSDERWRNLVGLRYAGYMGREEFREAVRKRTAPIPRTLFHLGACSSTTEKNADFLIDNNTRTTRELCEWSLANGVRFVYASSAATYGDGAQGYSDADSVTPALKPLNMYGYSKQMFDEWALKGGLLSKIAGLKYFNVYGPREAHKGDMRSVVNKAWHQIRETGEVQLFKSHHPKYKDGEQLRDFVYVRDAVAATLFFHDHPEKSGLFNCGTGKARTWNDLVRAVFSAMKKPVKIRYIDVPELLREKYQYYTQADITKLRDAGFRNPFTELEAGVLDYVAGYLEQR